MLEQNSDYFNHRSQNWDQSQHRADRAKTVANAILKSIPFSGKENVLDFGCGTGLLGFLLAGSAREIWFGDTSEGMLDEVRKKIHLQGLKNAHTLHLMNDLPIEQYDVIVSLMVLHHIENIEEQLTDLTSALNEGGYICLCDLDQEDGSFHSEVIVPHHGFDRNLIKGILQTNNVKIVTESTVAMDKKMIDGKLKEYPIFLIIGKKHG